MRGGPRLFHSTVHSRCYAYHQLSFPFQIDTLLFCFRHVYSKKKKPAFVNYGNNPLGTDKYLHHEPTFFPQLLLHWVKCKFIANKVSQHSI